MLVNLWATWCVPCRSEMPALDRLEGDLGGDDFEVVAINIDLNNEARARAFLDEVAIKNLAFYSDPTTGVFSRPQEARPCPRPADDAAGRRQGMPGRLGPGAGRMGFRRRQGADHRGDRRLGASGQAACAAIGGRTADAVARLDGSGGFGVLVVAR